MQLMGAVLSEAILRGRFSCPVDHLFILSFLPMHEDDRAFLYLDHISTRLKTLIFFRAN